MKPQRINFMCGKLCLEGVLGFPRDKKPFPAIIVCHPHPLYGGNMDNYVVEAVCAQAEEQGLAWLKFNFRGGRAECRKICRGNRGKRRCPRGVFIFS